VGKGVREAISTLVRRAQKMRRQALAASIPSDVATLQISRIVKGDNPRRYFSRRKHDELVVSIGLRGVLQPIIVRPAPDGSDLFAIVLGERRWRAAREVFGASGSIPVIIREMSDQEALEAAIDENDIRDDASETEQADAAVRVLAACKNDRAEAVRRLGWSTSKLARRLALAELCEPVKCALDERRIKIGHAELLAVIPVDKQEKALDTILKAGLDVSKTRDLLMRVTQNLGAACFDKTECTACPFNSTTQHVLFETHVEDGFCTNPGCFDLKMQAAELTRTDLQAQASVQVQADVGASRADGDEGHDDEDKITSAACDQEAMAQAGGNIGIETPAAGPPETPARAVIAPVARDKAAVSATSIAARTIELREAMWRTALARTLAANPAHAQAAILIAAMSGTLSQIKPETLTSRSGVLVGPEFPGLDYQAKIAQILALAPARAANILSIIGAAYAKDVQAFAHVAHLARTFEVDVRDIWQVDQAFLERYTKDELMFIAQECGLITHIGPKAFAKLLAGKKSELLVAMLNRPGFSWAGRLPAAMTLDGQYGPPPEEETPLKESSIAA
jgi:ParB family chromosome partitioning protein